MGQGLTMASSDEVISAAGLVEAALDRRSAKQCADLSEAAAACESVFARRASEFRDEAKSRLALGIPPSLRQLVGISNLEVPMNRVLGWMFDPESRGAAARRGLLALGGLLSFGALVDDIERGSRVIVRCEASPDLEITSRQPDLLIKTEHAAVLIENKVWSPESGPDQYSHYLEVLTTWAGECECRAYLLAPTVRDIPPGWAGSFSHRQLSDELRSLVVEPGISFWDRVVYGLIVSDLDPDPRSNRAREIERLVECGDSMSDVDVATKLSQLLRHPSVDPTNGGF